jgi:hypothetical protein
VGVRREGALDQRGEVPPEEEGDFPIQDGSIDAERPLLVTSAEEMESFISPALALARALDEAVRTASG